MKKLENSFVVSGFVGVDAEIRQFDSASVARFPISNAASPKRTEKTRLTFQHLPISRHGARTKTLPISTS